jgi:hypothetical protein
MVLRDLGVFHDPLQYWSSPEVRARRQPLLRAVQWNIIAPLMNRVLRVLRDEAGRHGAHAGRSS